MTDERTEMSDDEALGHLTAMEREVDVWLQAARGLRRLRDLITRGRQAQAILAGFEDRKAGLLAEIGRLETRHTDAEAQARTVATLDAQIADRKRTLATLETDIAEIKAKHGLSAVTAPAQ